MERHGPPESGPIDVTLLFLWNPTAAFQLVGDGSFFKFLEFLVRAVDFDMENEKESYIFLAKLAEKAERYDEMVENMKKVAKLDVELIAEERNLLSVGYKKVVGARRTSWRILSLIEQKQESSSNEQSVELIQSYRQKVEEELVQICDEILAIIDQHLIPSSSSIEPTIFYHKMKGDYSRYLAEFKTGEEKQNAADQSMKAYEIAFEKAKINLPPTHPIRLGLALNFSVLYYEILNSPDRACYLAKQAFDLAIAEQDNSSEEPHEDSALIIQLLRDNLQLWTSKLPPEDEETRLYCNSLGYYNADNEIEES